MKIRNQCSVRVLVISMAILGSGCASMTGSSDQTISVEARSNEGQVSGAMCELDNDKGKWFVSAPGSTRISRSNEDLIVTCKRDGLMPGIVTVESTTKGSMAGNILLGGFIGAIIDHNTGAAYQYPTLIQVMMGQTSEIRPKRPTNQTSDGSTPDMR